MSLPHSQDPSSTFSISKGHRRGFLRSIAGLAGLGFGVHEAISQADPEWIRVQDNGLSEKTIPLEQELSIQLVTPDKPSDFSNTAGTPLVFLFGGNGMGAVVKSNQALQLALALKNRGCASAILNYPDLQTRETFQQSIIAPIHKVLESLWAKEHHINLNQIATAGFSAGGLVATLLGTEYRSELNFKIKASVNYYGPVDLRQWFAFHLVRAGEMKYDRFYEGVRGPDEIGHSANGAIRCRDLSMKVIHKVAENLGGIRPGRLSPFSHDYLWDRNSPCSFSEIAPILGVFGTNDDNCDAIFQSKLLQRMSEKTGVQHESRIYEGPHGVGWGACPESLDWLMARLMAAKESAATLIA